MNVWLRPAGPAEAPALTDLALRSKAHWGYDENFLHACRAELTITPDDITTGRVVVAVANGRRVGFYAIDGTPPKGQIGHLWLDPGVIGIGLGRRLWKHAVATARAAGFTSLRIEADPHAEGFYLAMGAVRIGAVVSGSVEGRELPLLEFTLS